MTMEEQIERSQKIQESEDTLNSLFGQRALIKHENDILFYGRVDTTTVKKLDDWPDEIDILPADDVEFTLKEILTALSGKNVKLGATDSVGFIYCGEVKPGLISWLNKKSGLMYEAMNAELNKIRASIYNFERNYFPKYLERRKIAWIKSHRNAKLEDFPVNLEESKARAMENLKQQETRLASKIRRFTKLTDTLVDEMYVSISPDEEGTLIIMFEGAVTNSGNFWTTEECQTAPHINWEIDVLTNRR